MSVETKPVEAFEQDWNSFLESLNQKQGFSLLGQAVLKPFDPLFSSSASPLSIFFEEKERVKQSRSHSKQWLSEIFIYPSSSSLLPRGEIGIDLEVGRAELSPRLQKRLWNKVGPFSVFKWCLHEAGFKAASRLGCPIDFVSQVKIEDDLKISELVRLSVFKGAVSGFGWVGQKEDCIWAFAWMNQTR